MKGKIIITVINAIKDIAIAIFNVFHKKSKSSTETVSKEEPKTPEADNRADKIEIPPSPKSLRLSLLIKQSLLTDL